MSGDNAISDALRRLDRSVFVGRTHEIEALRAALDQARTGRGGIVLVAGEPGIGKSSLLQQVLDEPVRSTFGVFDHTCDPGLPAFWPWVRLITYLKDVCDSSVLRAQAKAVVQMLEDPNSFEAGTHQKSSVTLASLRHARFERFDRVLRVVSSAARSRPLLLHLEDVHAADPDSIQLMHYCAQQFSNVRALIIATYRQYELTDATAPSIEEIARRHPGRRLVLHGLSELEVRELVESVAGHTCASSFVHELFVLTDGNPLYTKEVLRHLLTQGILHHDGVRWTSRSMPRHMLLPRSLDELIWQRFGGISDAGRELLNAASVMGGDIDITIACHLADLCPRTGAAALAEVSTKQLLELGDRNTYRFHHPLYREVLHSRLSPSIRSRLHVRLGTMLEARYGNAARQHASELAHHFSEATSARGCDKAVRYACDAAQDSSAVMAHDEAARTLEVALRVLERARGRPSRLCDTMLCLAEALWRSGAFDRAREISRRAVEIARRLRSSDRLALAVLSYAGPLQGFGAIAVDHELVSLLHEALQRLPQDHLLRPLLMARIAEELAYTESDHEGRLLGRQAIDRARRRGDPAVYAATLRTAHWALWTLEGVQDRVTVADELLRLANENDDHRMGFDGELVRVWTSLELGDRSGAEVAVGACALHATVLREPYCQWLLAVTETCLALMIGKLEQVEALARTAVEFGASIQDPNCHLIFNGQMAHLCWLTGRFSELPRYYSEITDPHPLLKPTVSCARASMLCEMGRTADARGEFERWARDDFASVPRNPTWLFAIAIWSRVCAVLGDTKRAETLYRLLEPFDGRNVVCVPFFTHGAAAYFLGLLAATLDRWETAERHYESALSMNMQMGTSQWVARTQVAYASMLLRRPSPDSAQARVLLREAVRIGEALGMPTVVQQARIRLEQLPTSHRKPSRPSHPEPSAPRSQSKATFLQVGDYWRAEFEGQECYFRDLLGFHFIRELLMSPNKPMSALELVWIARPPSGPDEQLLKDHVWAFAHTYEPLLDGRTLFEIFRKLADLRTGLAEARVKEDQVLITTLTRKIAELRSCIKRACRPNGASRAYSTTAERARQIVRKNTSTAIEAIREKMPALATHFALCVKTGAYPCYIADPARLFNWES